MSSSPLPQKVEVLDTHTEGEPTRIVLGGWPIPSHTTMADLLAHLRSHSDALRQAIVCEPRGHDAIVGALLTPAEKPDSEAGIVFFNNSGWLGMCGHGLIGVVRGLEFLGRLSSGRCRFDTPVGTVEAELDEDGAVSFRNVAAQLLAADVEVDVDGLGVVRGDVAWGGNGFFITDAGGIDLSLDNLDELLRRSRAIAECVHRVEFLQRIAPDFDLGLIDHVEFVQPAAAEEMPSRNFVLCPGGDWDRSPCGTGTSARLASLHACGKLGIGDTYRTQSLSGGEFVGWLEERDGLLYPHIRGSAWVVSRSTLYFHERDPLAAGFSLLAPQPGTVPGKGSRR